MKISKILSCRSFETWVSYDLVFEWEDDFSCELQVPVINIPLVVEESRAQYWYRKVFHNRYSHKLTNNLLSYSLKSFHRKLFPRKEFNLVFELGVNTDPSAIISQESVPMIIDFWKHTDLDTFYNVYKNCKLVLISSLEVINYLKYNQCPLNIQHLPLSLPDRYAINALTTYEKRYDILFAGRPNTVLLNYMQEFAEKFPEIEYLRQENIGDELYYVSNKRGIVGKFHSRKEYIELLRASRISFYSTPGIDGGEKRTGGFNPVTPRFLELLSAQCLLLGRYSENEETAFYELDKVCPHIETYIQFENALLAYLMHPLVPLPKYTSILQKHYTSCRVKQLAVILEQE